jgi:Domain of unknown function (DUF5658)
MSSASQKVRWLLAAALLVALSAAVPPASAQQHAVADSPLLVEASLAAIIGATESVEPAPPPRAASPEMPRPGWPRTALAPAQSDRPLVLPALYVTFGALQALDAHSTLRALDRGQVEGNPVMRGIASQPAAVVGIKAATTAGTIFLTEKLSRRHRTAAIVLMVALNAGYLAVVSHNYRRAGAAASAR